jgi:glycosyltransferase involved in cell wall biosynthesis
VDITIIICTFNRSKLLGRVLEDIDRQVVPPEMSWEAVVVDNNSSDQTRAVVARFAEGNPEKFRYITEKRQGKSFALNRGVDCARGKIVAFTDDDVEIDRVWLCNIKKMFDSYGCSGVGGRIVARWPFEKPTWIKTDGKYGLMGVIVEFDLGDSVCDLYRMPFGANMAFKRSMFENYGLFRTDLGPRPGSKGYYEDTEFALRLRGGGEKLLYAPSAVVWHPVERERARKKYYQSWYFGYGRALVKTSGIPQEAVLYWGVPRYLFRDLGRDLFIWMTSMHSEKRLYYRLNACLKLGMMIETMNSQKSW